MLSPTRRCESSTEDLSHMALDFYEIPDGSNRSLGETSVKAKLVVKFWQLLGVLTRLRHADGQLRYTFKFKTLGLIKPSVLPYTARKSSLRFLRDHCYSQAANTRKVS